VVQELRFCASNMPGVDTRVPPFLPQRTAEASQGRFTIIEADDEVFCIARPPRYSRCNERIAGRLEKNYKTHLIARWR